MFWHSVVPISKVPGGLNFHHDYSLLWLRGKKWKYKMSKRFQQTGKKKITHILALTALRSFILCFVKCLSSSRKQIVFSIYLMVWNFFELFANWVFFCLHNDLTSAQHQIALHNISCSQDMTKKSYLLPGMQIMLSGLLKIFFCASTDVNMQSKTMQKQMVQLNI